MPAPKLYHFVHPNGQPSLLHNTKLGAAFGTPEEATKAFLKEFPDYAQIDPTTFIHNRTGGTILLKEKTPEVS